MAENCHFASVASMFIPTTRQRNDSTVQLSLRELKNDSHKTESRPFPRYSHERNKRIPASYNVPWIYRRKGEFWCQPDKRRRQLLSDRAFHFFALVYSQVADPPHIKRLSISWSIGSKPAKVRYHVLRNMLARLMFYVSDFWSRHYSCALLVPSDNGQTLHSSDGETLRGDNQKVCFDNSNVYLLGVILEINGSLLYCCRSRLPSTPHSRPCWL